MMFRKFDQYLRCACGHIKAHHTSGEPFSCRMRTCECESFIPPRKEGRQ